LAGPAAGRQLTLSTNLGRGGICVPTASTIIFAHEVVSDVPAVPTMSMSLALSSFMK
jgi:hypothetical protein